MSYLALYLVIVAGFCTSSTIMGLINYTIEKMQYKKQADALDSLLDSLRDAYSSREDLEDEDAKKETKLH